MGPYRQTAPVAPLGVRWRPSRHQIRDRTAIRRQPQCPLGPGRSDDELQDRSVGEGPGPDPGAEL